MYDKNKKVQSHTWSKQSTPSQAVTLSHIPSSPPILRKTSDTMKVHNEYRYKD